MANLEVVRFGDMDREENVEGFSRSMKLKFQNCGVEFPKNGKFVEVGSGNGTLLNFLRKEGLDIEGVDVEPRGEGVMRADIAALPYKDESFDCVISKHVFDRVVYPSQDEQKGKTMQREIARVLKKGGWYYAAEIFFDDLKGFERIYDRTSNQYPVLYRKIV